MQGLKADCEHLIPHVREGGYFVVHDYFGWYDNDKEGWVNKSPIKRMAQELTLTGKYEQILIDTGYMSFVIFRKKYQHERMLSNNLDAMGKSVSTTTMSAADLLEVRQGSTASCDKKPEACAKYDAHPGRY